MRRGVVAPAAAYRDGTYDSTGAVPSPVEQTLYALRVSRSTFLLPSDATHIIVFFNQMKRKAKLVRDAAATADRRDADAGMSAGKALLQVHKALPPSLCFIG